MNDPPIYNIVTAAQKRALNQTFFFMWATKHCPLSFNERLVWSLLVKAERTKGQGTTQADIADWSGLSPKAIRKAVRSDEKLMKSGLVVREHHRSWRAVEPGGETATWFAARKSKSDHWADRMAYWPVDVSVPKPESLFDRVLLGLLRTLKGNKPAAYQECYESLAVVLGCDYRRVKSGMQRLQQSKVVEVINTMTNRYGRVVRFDVLLCDGDQAAQPAQVLGPGQPVSQQTAAEPPVKPTTRPMPQVNKHHLANITPACRQPAKVIHEVPVLMELASSRNQATESSESSPVADRFAPIRRLDGEMRAYMQDVKHYEDWRIGQILGVLCKVPLDDRQRVFYAIVKKHGGSPTAVLAEVRNYVERTKRRVRTEAQEFFELEAMSLFVTA